MGENCSKRQYHTFAPVYQTSSEILILGSFPSVKSREEGFYYGHPRNRFWSVLAELFHVSVPATIEEKKELLFRNRIALWDVVASCEIEGSSDSSIRQVVPTDLQGLLSKTNIRRIYTNGKMAQKLYERYEENKVGKRSVCLPSTSPANAMFDREKLLFAWSKILE